MFTDPMGLFVIAIPSIPVVAAVTAAAVTVVIVKGSEIIAEGLYSITKELKVNDTQSQNPDNSVHDDSSRPEGIPNDWVETPTDDGGKKWTNPKDDADWVRQSPAKPQKPYSREHVPNTKRHTPRGYLDENGNLLDPADKGPRHIPSGNFKFFP